MKAAVLYGVHDLRIEDIPEPKIKSSDEVLIRITHAGICKSDIHYYEQGRIGSASVEEPIIPGHEFSGIVEETGSDVTALKKGDRVAVEPGIPCGVCEFCSEGNYNICPDIRFCGTPPVNGAFCEKIVFPSEWCFLLPSNVSLVEGAMVEPLSVSIHAVDLAKIRTEDFVVVLGAGPIGLGCIQLAKNGGAHEVWAADYLNERLKLASNLGADRILSASKGRHVCDILKQTGGRGVDVVIEAAGTTEAPDQGAQILKPGGRLILVGIPEGDTITLNASNARRKGLTIKLSRRTKHSYPGGVEMIASGKVDVKSLVTHTFRLDQIVEALEIVRHYEDGVIKAVIEI